MNAARSAALSALAAATVVSCVLFVSPDDYGTRCRIAGEETACGACIAAACQPAVDACCRAGDRCASGLALVEQCAEGDLEACKTLPSEFGAIDPARKDLGTCAERQCGVRCREASAKSLTRCSAPIFGQGKACTCAAADESGVGSAANDVVCSEADFPGTHCCAPEGWPAPGLGCDCTPLSCKESLPGRCFCTLYPGPSLGGECTLGAVGAGGDAGGGACCVDHETCACSESACRTADASVPKCDLAAVGCPPGRKRVTSCSVRVAQ